MARRQRAAKNALQARSRRPSGRVSGRATTRREALSALDKESDRQLDELILRRLDLPIEQRMNFLRRRLPGGGSCL